MSVVDKFNSLNGKQVTRKRIESIINLAKKENNAAVIYRLSKVLLDNPKDNVFKLEITEFASTGLNAPRHSGSYKDALDNCGRLKPGYKFENGSVTKIAVKKKMARKKRTDLPAKKTTSKSIVKTAAKPKVTVTKKKASTKKAPASTNAKTPVKPLVKPVVKNTQDKPKVTRKRNISSNKKLDLDAINPKSFAEKPKSISVATAINDVLGTGKYPDIKPMQANVLFSVLKDKEDLFDEFVPVKVSNFQKAILKGIDNSYIIYWDDSTVSVYDLTEKLIKSINSRLESLRNQKTNYSMFPGLKGRKKQTGLKATAIENIEVVAEEVKPLVETFPAVPQPRPGSIAHRLQQKQNVVREYYRVDNQEISDFLGRIEKKTKESVVITMTGGQGSGKTRFLFQVMNAFAQNYRCGHASMEEHPDSSLYEDKALQYLNATALNNVDNPEVKSLQDLEKLIEENEVIFIDSFQKLQELIPRYEVDKDLRKKYDGKLFVIVFQQTSSGSMRGGTKSQFDGDIILMTEKFEDYKENYIYPDKNRYNDIPAPELKFNIFSGTMLRTEGVGNTEPEGVTVDLEKLNFDVE